MTTLTPADIKCPFEYNFNFSFDLNQTPLVFYPCQLQDQLTQTYHATEYSGDKGFGKKDCIVTATLIKL